MEDSASVRAQYIFCITFSFLAYIKANAELKHIFCVEELLNVQIIMYLYLYLSVLIITVVSAICGIIFLFT